MRISDRHLRDVLQAYLEQLSKPGRPERLRTGTLGPAAEADSFTLSPEAAQVRRLVQMLEQMPEVRQEKVRELAERIGAGTYDAPIEDILDALLGKEGGQE